MINLSLTEKEIELMKKSIAHCLKTCRNGGTKEGCTDCEILEELLKKLG